MKKRLLRRYFTKGRCAPVNMFTERLPPDYLGKVRIFRYDRDLYVRGVYNGTVVKEVCVWDY